MMSAVPRDAGLCANSDLASNSCVEIEPSFPNAAEMPWQVHRYLVGNISAGIYIISINHRGYIILRVYMGLAIYVRVFGPAIQLSIHLREGSQQFENIPKLKRNWHAI